MTETPAAPDTTQAEAATGSTAPARKRGGGLSAMLLADLKSMASGLGIAGARSMKKAQLVEAITAAQSGGPSAAQTGAPQSVAQSGQSAGDDTPDAPRKRTRSSAPPEQSQTQAPQESQQEPQRESQQEPQDKRQKEQDTQEQGTQEQDTQAQRQQEKANRRQQQDKQDQRQQEKANQRQQDQQDQRQKGQARGQGKNQQDQQNQQNQQDQERTRQDKRQQQDQRQQDQRQDQRQQDQRQDQPDSDDDGEGGSRRNRRRRGRERTVARQGGRNEPDTTILEDDVLVPAAGIIDVLDNYAFVRTSGYLPGNEDVYLSLSMVRRYGLRRGDAVVGQVRQPREGERREKFNPMVRIDSVNGADPESAKDRPEFTSATPVHPDQRLRLATDASNVIGRVIDIAAPVGKGQRGLLLAPPRTGTTALLQSVATSVTTNNPECHVMVVLVDTRPEEVTDFQRAVKGEVIASTFDREPADHTVVAELAIERAKRLVELGHDVVVLLDSLTRLGRAYNLAAPANGRVLGGGVDATAVHPTKQFFGAARNIEDGGSLTILATVPVETGSAVDELFLEELSGAANLELRLSSQRAAKGIVPAVDPVASGTRHEELLLAPAEGAVVGDLRKKLAAASSQKDILALVSGGR